MGIFNKVFSRSSVIVITPIGKDKVEHSALFGDRGKVLSALFETSPCTAGELAEETGMDEGKVKSIIKALIRGGYAKRSGTNND